MNNIRKSSEYIQFVEECLSVKKYACVNVNIPEDVDYKYRGALLNYRMYLDSVGCLLRPPKYIYDNKNKTTWRYISCVIAGDKFTKWIDNPEFKFGGKI